MKKKRAPGETAQSQTKRRKKKQLPNQQLTENELLKVYRETCKTWDRDMLHILNPHVDLDASIDTQGDATTKREMLLAEDGDLEMAEKYAWAIPDERALRIIEEFSPIVEMGAGRGYWAALLRLRGVDTVAYDINLPGPHDQWQNWTTVLRGGPDKLEKHADRTLLLCYPDDFEDSSESVACSSLLNFKGNCCIHIGELMGDSLCRPGCWGRTTSEDAQTFLNTAFHCILKVPIPSWNTSRDTISVWKRTTPIMLMDNMYAHIPETERIDQVLCSPSTMHLVKE